MCLSAILDFYYEYTVYFTTSNLAVFFFFFFLICASSLHFLVSKQKLHHTKLNT